jgi:hypothetical protein
MLKIIFYYLDEYKLLCNFILYFLPLSYSRYYILHLSRISLSSSSAFLLQPSKPYSGSE